MKMILPGQREQMLANFQNQGPDHAPVVKWFCPWGAATWLLSEMKPGQEDSLFGLCDLGFGMPEMGTVSRNEIEAVTGMGGLKIERDIHFEPRATLSVYAQAARQADQIVTDSGSLMRAYLALAEQARRDATDLRGRVLSDGGETAVSHPAFIGPSAIR